METHVIKLCCNGCGSDLQVTDDVRFLTCNYCHSKLEVVRDVSVTHTRVLEKIEQTTDRIAGNLKVIELQNDLERLDREWEATRQGMLVRGEHGEVSEPSAVGAVFGGILLMIGGVMFALFSANMGGAPGFFPLFGIGIAVAGLFKSISGSARASDFRNLQATYQAKRWKLARRIDEERGGASTGGWSPVARPQRRPDGGWT